jgi:N-acetylneuraminate synthase
MLPVTPFGAYFPHRSIISDKLSNRPLKYMFIKRDILDKLSSFIFEQSIPLVIAEIGINHSGDFNLAKELILNAKNCGAQAIKFQYRNLNRTYSEQKNEIGDSIVGDEIVRNFLTVEEIIELAQFANQMNILIGISFFTCEDIEDFSSNIMMFDFYKVPSAELTNLKLKLI